jgi:chromate transport protein ChrA
MGAGLGTATQGIRHITGSDTNVGWQEGGLGKLAIELGVPGLIAALLLVLAIMRMMMRISKHPDIDESSQFVRVMLFALVVANMANFVASAQAYSDPVLTLMTAFFVGCLFATATLDERAAAAAAVPAPRVLAPATA